MGQKNFSLVWQSSQDRISEDPPGSNSFASIDFIKKIIIKNDEIRGKVIVIKLSSNIIDNDALLSLFSQNIYILTQHCGAKIYIVHDYSELVTDELKNFGIYEKLLTEDRIIDSKCSKIIEMIISGYINKIIVSKLCLQGCQAIGISGKDANLIQARKSRQLNKRIADPDIIDVGFISEPIFINPEILLNFEDGDYVTLISPIAGDEKGRTHLLDANITASLISTALCADYLIFLSEDKEIFSNTIKICDSKSIKSMALKKLKNPKSKRLIEAVSNAIDSSKAKIYLAAGDVPDAILLSLFS